VSAPELDKDGKRRYGVGMAERDEDPARCIEQVWENTRWPSAHQCNRKRGHGEGGLWCKIHDPVAVKARQAASHAKFEREMENSPHRRIERLTDLLSDCADYFDNKADGDENGPNQEGRLLQRIENIIGERAEARRPRP
jgi:hypothetical protein